MNSYTHTLLPLSLSVQTITFVLFSYQNLIHIQPKVETFKDYIEKRLTAVTD